MINHTVRNEFLIRHAANCSAEELFKNFIYYFDNYSRGEQSDVESLDNCIWYLARLLNRYRPDQVIRIIYNVEGSNLSKITKKNEEFLYIYLMYQMTTLRLLYKQYKAATLWAKKTVMMIEYFHPFASDVQKRRMIKKNFNYYDAENILNENITHFDYDVFESGMIFNWENNLFFPTPANNLIY